MRINAIPVELLADAHLRAEYLEIHAMMFTYYRRSILERKTSFRDEEIPDNYILGKGHAKFFYNKMYFVKCRWNSIKDECKKRGFKTNLKDLQYNLVKEKHRNNWIPNNKDIEINLERIIRKIYIKSIVQNNPKFYKYNKKIMSFLDWCILYTEKLNVTQEYMFNLITEIKEEFKGDI